MQCDHGTLNVLQYTTGVSSAHKCFVDSSLNLCLAISSRSYSKKAKEGKKELSKKSQPAKSRVTLSEDELNRVISFDKVKSQMSLTLDHLKKEYLENLTLRTSHGTLDNIRVETVDGTFPLIQLGQVIQKSPQLIMINMLSTPQYMTQVKLAVTSVGLNPQQDGTTIFVPVPKVTREHREMLAKNAKVFCEKTKEKLRNIQNTFSRELRKAKDDHSEDLIFNLNEVLLTTTREFIEQAEELMIRKQKDLLDNQ